MAFFGTDNRYAIGKARRELGYSPQVDLRDGIRLAARWYRQQGRSSVTEAPATGNAAEQVAI